MSGVMLKIAIYGFVRMTFDLLGGGPAWWGGLVLTAGAVSAVLGVLYAMMQRDLKRLLAYSSVENVGIIVMGLGAALVLGSMSQPALAALALSAGLFHAANHAFFKSLLFLGAGAIDHATGTKDLERLGGLIRRMPQTAAIFLVGAASISALPPLNGFASEWLTFQALVGVGIHGSSVLVALGAVAAVGLLALTGALAAACFVKAFGIAFLALPRSIEASKAVEAPVALRIGMGALGLICITLGLRPGRALEWLGGVTSQFYNVAPRSSPLGDILTPSGTGLAPIGVLGALIVLGVLPVFVLRFLGNPPVRRAAVWVCGWNLEARMQYGSTTFAKPVRLFFRAILQPERSVEYGYAQRPYFVNRIRYEASIRPLIERHLYGSITNLLLRIANAVRMLQNGSMRLYLAYVLATLIIILVVAARS
jgi:hydrogenase-4 component B